MDNLGDQARHTACDRLELPCEPAARCPARTHRPGLPAERCPDRTDRVGSGADLLQRLRKEQLRKLEELVLSSCRLLRKTARFLEQEVEPPEAARNQRLERRKRCGRRCCDRALQ